MAGEPASATIKAVVFDLDEVLLDRGRAWQYALEEGVAMVCGCRIDGGPLVSEYSHRPWRHAVTVVVPDVVAREACEAACARIYQRGAQKRLLVHDGVGMGLDWIRSAQLAMGAVSREPHAVALKQLQSTGLDRFMTVLSPTPAGQDWDSGARVGECISYLRREACEVAFVSAEELDLEAAEQLGCRVAMAAWAGRGGGSRPAVTTPAMLGPALAALTAAGD
ncbi:MAG TPA: HAD hydrolase-like protein [Tepidiformaceae bacterium]|nr:HAD hydrolase-like protein [Tepidiformaceae bacterium]